MKRKTAGILCLAMLILLTACGQAVPTVEETVAKQMETTVPTETTQVTVPPTTLPAPTEPEITAPDDLLAVLTQNNIALQDLEFLGCTQLVTVIADGTSAQIDLYVLENYRWQQQEALHCSGFVGKNGTTAEKREGDKATPKGLYPIVEAFYIQDAPQTGLPLFQITDNTYWVDDPASQYYNKRVEGLENKDWTSAEQMIRYSSYYEYGFVVGYNTEGIPDAGSAIFMHVSNRYTAGCIATDRDFLLQYLAILSEEKTPYILID